MKRRGQRESGYAKWKTRFLIPAQEHLPSSLLHNADNKLTANHVSSLGYFRHGCHRNFFFLLCFADSTVNTKISSLEDTGKFHFWNQYNYLSFFTISIYKMIYHLPDKLSLKKSRQNAEFIERQFVHSSNITNLLNYTVVACLTKAA